MARLLVVADGDGNIKAATRLSPSDGAGGASGIASFVVDITPNASEEVHAVALPDELRAPGSLESLNDYHLEVSDGKARLAKRGT
ncbi:hypothetical protein [Streptomyces yangpuensis]|uniref:hypothetical protein n=1 Tax=Streptomyces yangpuensis TaxID=1648182 RepID=UPI003659F007